MPTTLTLRLVKGSGLSNAENDGNLTSLKDNKAELSNNLSDLTDASVARTNLGLAIGVNVQAYSAELTAVAALSTGIAARTGSGTWAVRTITMPAAGLSITNGDGVSGNPTVALANDLSALEALASTGIAVRTTTDTWAQRSVAGTSNRITVTNGDGVSGNPTVDISSSYVGQATITTVGTIGTGTWASTITTADSNFTLTNGTKSAKFNVSAISGGTTRTFALPDVNDTIATLNATQTLAAKTLTSPTITNVSINSGDIDDVTIGAVTPGAGTFTSVSVGATLNLAATSGASAGVLTIDSVPWFHAYGASNLFLGQNSGNFTLSGTQNIGIGQTVMQSLTSGNLNIGIGTSALTANTSGSYNLAIGWLAMTANTTGQNNVAIGLNSMASNIDGSNNIGIGQNSLYANTSGSQNIGIGDSALVTNTSGSNNTAIGTSALEANSTGTGNVAVGNFSMFVCTTGTSNSAFGRDSLRALIDGTNNAGIGYGALSEVTSGGNNVGIGYLAGVTTVGANANVTGSNNTWVGYNSGPGTTTQLSNATAIGNGATSSTSNEVTLGNASVTVIRSMAVNLCDLGTSATPMKTVYAGTSVVVGLTTNNGVTTSAVASASNPTIAATGVDTNIALSIFTKGTGNLNLIAASTGSVRAFTNTSLVQLEVYHTASADRYVRITGANAGNPSITTSAGSLILTGASAHVAFGSAALATNATTGFVCIPSCAGAPTGVPASIPTGQIPMVFDSTNLFLYVYTGAAWKKSSVYA